MDEVNAISQAIHEAMTIEEQDETTLIELVSRYLSSPTLAIRSAGVDTLHDVLHDATEDQKKLVLEETSLTLIPLLLKLFPSNPAKISAIFRMIAQTSRPREVVLALNEALQGIDERAEESEVSDDEDEGGGGSDGLVFFLESILVLECYMIALPRLPNTKSTPTLISLSSGISSTLPPLVRYATPATAREALTTVCQLVQVAWEWVQTTSDKGGEQRAILTQLLFMGIAMLGAEVEACLAERYFTTHYPRFRLTHPDTPESDGDDGLAVLESCKKTSDLLNISTSDLIHNLIHYSSITTHSSLASLVLLSVSPPSSFPTTLLNDSIPVLYAALPDSIVDSGLKWLWLLVEAKCDLPVDTAELLLHLLVPLASSSPRPLLRLSTFKLISNIILLVPHPIDQIVCLRQLLEPENPYQGIRVQSLTLLSELISSQSTRLLIPDLYSMLSPILFTLPRNLHDLGIDEILSTMYPAWFTSCAQTLFVWTKVDISNSSSIKDRQIQEWINPQIDLISKVRHITPLDDFQSHFVLDRWEDALQRIN